MPSSNSRAVAEITPLLRLGALRKYPCLDHACRSGSDGRGQALDVFLQEPVLAQNLLL
jgi:lactate dehydrogenase-like 2-hydroxyacid dehydrogenase